MKKKVLWSVSILLFLTSFIIGVSINHIAKEYRANGSKFPTKTNTIPHNEHGYIIYITKQQDRNLNGLLLAAIIGFMSYWYICYKVGLPFSGAWLEFKKRKK